MTWGYKIKSSGGRTITKSKPHKTLKSAKKSAHSRLHKKDIPKGSYSEVSKIDSKKKKGFL